MAVYEKEIKAPFSEVHAKIRKQLLDNLRYFKVREESTYKKENFNVLVMVIEPNAYLSKGKSQITVTIAGTEESSWVSVIGCETSSQIKIRAGFELEPDAIQIIKSSLKCY